MNIRYFLSLFLLPMLIFSQSGEELSVVKIMQDPLISVGSLPSSPYWSEDGKTLYFMWNPSGAESDSLYAVSAKGGAPQKLSAAERRKLPSRWGNYNQVKTQKVYTKSGDLFILDIKSGSIRQLTNTVDWESSPAFSHDEKSIVFSRGGNLFTRRLSDGLVTQVTDFRKGSKPKDGKKTPHNANEKWVQAEEAELIGILAERSEEAELAKERREQNAPDRPLKIYTGKSRVRSPQLSPNQRFVTFRLQEDASGAKDTKVPDYVREDGYADHLNARPKVGSPQDTYKFGIYDTQKDTVYYVDVTQLSGIYDEYNFSKAADDTTKGKQVARNVVIYGPYWSDDGKNAAVVVRAWDNKDRWILLLDPISGTLTELDRQHDEAWVGGPGISGWVFNAGNIGWLPDNRRVWFQSEESGYSHLYTVDIRSKQKKALTSGNFEVTDAEISRDKKSWYLTTSEVHPGERHFYRMPLNGGKRTKITSMTGSNEVTLSPDEKMMAFRHSFSNQPWQLYLAQNKTGAKASRVTNTLSEQFKSYDWRAPEVITFEARDGATVHARLYRPENAEKNGPAVVFVHGAGYLQNAHKWWSVYFREYMFHNLLVDKGYTVLDIDYRASAGYGRDWRTGIYRHMGGKDLTDHVDGAKYLTENYDVDPARIGIYGGSYGGFITFMALFTTPDVFACGAALRPVSDWAHYNHPYTSNILNEPQLDSLAYRRSSPIYHAEGLKKPLLICHGMIDTNVHFQDVVRLAQRLIELGKDDWEVALYPLEGHGFKEPSSWTDEYKRVLKLFEMHLK